MGHFSRSRNSKFTGIIKLKLTYLVLVFISLLLSQFQLPGDVPSRKNVKAGNCAPLPPPKFWVGVCRTVLKTLTLFQTKIYDFSYHFSDLTPKICTPFQT